MTLLVQKAYAAAATSGLSRHASCVHTHGTLVRCVRTQAAVVAAFGRPAPW